MDNLDKKELLLNQWEKRLIEWEKQLSEKEKTYKLGLAFINGNHKYLDQHYYDYIDTKQIESITH